MFRQYVDIVPRNTRMYVVHLYGTKYYTYMYAQAPYVTLELHTLELQT